MRKSRMHEVRTDLAFQAAAGTFIVSKDIFFLLQQPICNIFASFIIIAMLSWVHFPIVIDTLC